MNNQNRLGVMVDCSRNAVLNLQGVKHLIDLLQKMGYNMLMLYTEDTFEVDNQPLFGYLRGRYTKDELKEIVAYGEERGIELIPCIQTLAHLNQIFMWNTYKAYRDCDDILLVGDDRTYALIEDMFKTLRECFKTDTLHIGMDEAFNLGKGQYKDLHGEENRFDILKAHLEKVVALAQKYGFKPLMWSDMFFRLANNGKYRVEEIEQITPEIIKTAPNEVGLVYWDYGTRAKEPLDKMMKAHKRFPNDIWFAGGAWTWQGLAPRNGHSIEATKVALSACRDNGIENIIMTSWGDDGGECSIFHTLPTLFYAAEVYRGNNDTEAIKAKFKELFGIAFDDFCALDAPSTPTDFWKTRHDALSITFLYTDPFLGWIDMKYAPLFTNENEVTENYERYAKQLAKHKNHSEFGYMFRSMSSLCRVLALKWNLGLKTRRAYESKDQADLAEVIALYRETEKRLEVFYNAYRADWYHDKKGNGFEVQVIRLGGLRARLADCRERLKSYLDGEIDKIEELEEKLIVTGQPEHANRWCRVASVAKIAWGV